MDENKDPRMRDADDKDVEQQIVEQKEEQKEDQKEEQQSEYSFLQETIKDETGGKKAKKDILRMIGLGLVFGITASISFFALKPWIEGKSYSDPKQVTIPTEDDEAEDNKENNIQEPVQPELDSDSYREMNSALNEIANTVNKSVVVITGIASEQDWMTDTFDTRNSVSGLIVADNGQELLIFGKTSILKDIKQITVTFADGASCKADLKKQDAMLGFGIYGVARTDIQANTWQVIQTAALGSSNGVTKGDVMMALGNPFGYDGAVGFGVAASSKNVVEKADGRYKLICTDIAGHKDGTGVLANIKGEVIGMIDQTVSREGGTNLITAYGITDLKNMIELLSNGKGVPYIGIRGIDVTEEAVRQGVPAGVYVKEVDVDSPAMAAGIQNGDVITSFGSAAVESLAGYHTTLIDKEVGAKIKVKGQRLGAGGGYVDIDFDVVVGSRE